MIDYVTADATLLDAMRAIDRGGLQMITVCDDNRMIRGIITDGDLRRGILRGALLCDPVAGLVNRDYCSIESTVTTEEAAKRMIDKGLTCAPVVDAKGHLVDIYRLPDLLRAKRRPNWAVIMAGGKGERLGELTQQMPKPMMPVGDKPILEHIVRHLVGHGINRIFLAVNYCADQIERHFGDGSSFHCRIEYLRERDPLGTAGALSLLPSLPTDPVLVMNGDLMTGVDIGKMLDFHVAGGFDATMGTRPHPVKIPFGVIEVSDSGKLVTQVDEKPTMTVRVNAGVYVLQPIMLRTIHTVPAAMTDLLVRRIGSHGGLGAFSINESWRDVGTPAELENANAACR